MGKDAIKICGKGAVLREKECSVKGSHREISGVPPPGEDLKCRKIQSFGGSLPEMLINLISFHNKNSVIFPCRASIFPSIPEISMQSQHFPLNTLFKPSPSMKTWYKGGIALILGLILLFTVVPVELFSDLPAGFSVIILGGTLLLYALLWYWVDLYYESMWYELREDEINWKRGVWFRTTGIIAYNRITNLDVRQGPFMRFLWNLEPLYPDCRLLRTGHARDPH